VCVCMLGGGGEIPPLLGRQGGCESNWKVWQQLTADLIMLCSSAEVMASAQASIIVLGLWQVQSDVVIHLNTGHSPLTGVQCAAVNSSAEHLGSPNAAHRGGVKRDKHLFRARHSVPLPCCANHAGRPLTASTRCASRGAALCITRHPCAPCPSSTSGRWMW